MATQTLPAAAPSTTTFDEFLATYEGVHAEWVDGRVYVMSPGNERQSKLTGFLDSVIQYWADVHDLGEAYVPPFSVKVTDRRAREPDVFFVRKENLHQVHGTHVDGPVDLVVEIISRESRGRDRGDKYYEYQQAGVREYWLIDPLAERVEAYRLGQGGYDVVSLGDPPVLGSEALPGMVIPVSWLWMKPLPKLPWVYKEWGLI
jgi:Uma2 family endonuclease